MRLQIVTVLLLLLSGCTTSTPHGKCVGINGTKNPVMRYEYDTTNVVVAVIFAETIVVPIIVLMDELQCPIGPALK